MVSEPTITIDRPPVNREILRDGIADDDRDAALLQLAYDGDREQTDIVELDGAETELGSIDAVFEQPKASDLC